MPKISDDLRQVAEKLEALTWRDMMAFSQAVNNGAKDLVRRGDFDAAGMAMILTSIAEEILNDSKATHD